jgi:hypothetical protein
MIEMGKEYRTRDGDPVRIYSVEGANAMQPVVGERLFLNDVWTASAWDKEGRWNIDGTEHRFDLIEVKPVQVFQAWINIYKDGSFVTWRSLRAAEGSQSKGVIATLHIRQEYREGDGLCDDSAKT